MGQKTNVEMYRRAIGRHNNKTRDNSKNVYQAWQIPFQTWDKLSSRQKVVLTTLLVLSVSYTAYLYEHNELKTSLSSPSSKKIPVYTVDHFHQQNLWASRQYTVLYRDKNKPMSGCQDVRTQEILKKSDDPYQPVMPEHGDIMAKILSAAPIDLVRFEIQEMEKYVPCVVREAVKLATRRKVPLINLSMILGYGHPAINGSFEEAVDSLKTTLYSQLEPVIKDYQGLIFAATGNTSCDLRQKPFDSYLGHFQDALDFKNVILIAGTDINPYTKQLEFNPQACYGERVLAVDVRDYEKYLATLSQENPQQQLLFKSVQPMWSYKALDTSCATAYATYAAATIFAQYPLLQETPLCIESIFRKSATNFVKDSAGHTIPLINLEAALQLAHKESIILENEQLQESNQYSAIRP